MATIAECEELERLLAATEAADEARAADLAAALKSKREKLAASHRRIESYNRSIHTRAWN